MALLKIVFCLGLILATSGSVDIAEEPVSRSVQSRPDVHSPNVRAVPQRALVVSSNLPFVLQQQLAQALDSIYAKTTSGALRAQLFQTELMARAPNMYWDVVINYQFLQYYSKYNIRLRASNNDDVLAFGK